MKKTIKILAEKMSSLQERQDGTLEGGFASIKGGYNDVPFSTNESCSNTVDCRLSSNTGTPVCSNTGTCIM
jgi:hypothetical protein